MPEISKAESQLGVGLGVGSHISPLPTFFEGSHPAQHWFDPYPTGSAGGGVGEGLMQSEVHLQGPVRNTVEPVVPMAAFASGGVPLSQAHEWRPAYEIHPAARL